MTKQRLLAAFLLVAVVLLLVDPAVQRSQHAVLVALIGTFLAVVMFVGLRRGRRPGR